MTLSDYTSTSGFKWMGDSVGYWELVVCILNNPTLVPVRRITERFTRTSESQIEITMDSCGIQSGRRDGPPPAPGNRSNLRVWVMKGTANDRRNADLSFGKAKEAV